LSWEAGDLAPEEAQDLAVSLAAAAAAAAVTAVTMKAVTLLG
jgi:hypothetical protein